jgi:hypothetical protein
MATKPIEQTTLPYARHASPEFNARMHAWLTGLSGEVLAALGDNLTALILGGGYGRGEGGVLRAEGKERPYNDLDFTLIVRSKGSLPMAALDAIKHKYERLTGIDVDFSRPLTLEDVRRWRPTLMWSDLLHGHMVLQGPADILTANAPAMPSEALPPIEATRLLLNRGAGLLWALRVLRGIEAASDNDFIRRNYFKCALALGDALLISHGRFATPYSGRERRLAQLLAESGPLVSFDLTQLYEDALRFKFWPGDATLQPKDADMCRLSYRWGQVLLHVENRRARKAWDSLSDYAQADDLREPEQNSLRHWPRNFIRNRQCGRWSVRYPREALYRELPVLLELCGAVAGDWAQRSERFLSIWKRVN